LPATAICKDRKISIETVLSGYFMLMREQGLSGVYTDKETVHVCRYCQQRQFEKIGFFLLK
jgi:hypothetical protein